VQTGVPLLIHLPGWQRRAHEVVDIVLAEGVDPAAVVLCHMDPSGKDTAYQREVAARGVWLEFDMIGMPFNFPGEGQSPSVEDTVEAVRGLIADGHADRLLLSHDVVLKAMWTRNGGNGYGFVPTAFLPRLVEAGVPADTARALTTTNPAALFVAAARSVAVAR
jgi:phosphotriesterase-related protein